MGVLNGLATAARVVHVVLLALGIGAAAQLLTLSDALSVASLQIGSEVQTAVRAQLDGFMIIAAPILLVTLGLGWVPLQAQLRARIIGVGVWTLLALVSGQWLSPQLVAVRGQLGRAIDGLTTGAPGLADWSQLATISESLLVAQLIVGVFLLLASMISIGPKRSYGGIQL